MPTVMGVDSDGTLFALLLCMGVVEFVYVGTEGIASGGAFGFAVR